MPNKTAGWQRVGHLGADSVSLCAASVVGQSVNGPLYNVTVAALTAFFDMNLMACQ